jgi:hypothetical protein
MPDHLENLTTEQLEAGLHRLAAAVFPRNPECQQGKHPNCDGRAWDHEADVEVACRCSCHAEVKPEQDIALTEPVYVPTGNGTTSPVQEIDR